MLKRRNDSLIMNSFKSHEVHGKQVDILEKEGKLVFALHHLDKAISENPFHGFGMERGSRNVIFILEGGGNLHSITQESDEYVKAHMEKAHLLSSKGRLTEAINELKRALSINEGVQFVYYHLASFKAALGSGRKEMESDLHRFLTSRKMYFRRIMSKDFTEMYLPVFNELYRCYVSDLERRMNLLEKLGRTHDIMPYFTISRDL